MIRSVSGLCILIFAFAAVPLMAGEESEKLIAESKSAARRGERDRAVELATKAVEGDPDNARLRFYRGTLFQAARKHADAIGDFNRVIELEPRQADAYDQRGSEQFKLGKIAESIADFDRAIELDPAREAGHWRRGISYYYAGRFDEGRKQFEGYQTIDGNDVENVVWRFLCMARHDDVPTARRDLYKVKNDRRVPMMEIYAMFAGKATADDVLKAARAGDPADEELRHRLFYADLYVGLYEEAQGHEAAARKHLEAAVDRPIGHYMWDVAKVHLDLLKRPPPDR